MQDFANFLANHINQIDNSEYDTIMTMARDDGIVHGPVMAAQGQDPTNPHPKYAAMFVAVQSIWLEISETYWGMCALYQSGNFKGASDL